MRCKTRAVASGTHGGAARAVYHKAPATRPTTANNVQRELRTLPANKCRRKNSKTPQLRALRYGTPYCQLCRRSLGVGELVAWWELTLGDGRVLPTVYCADCHHANVRNGRALW